MRRWAPGGARAWRPRVRVGTIASAAVLLGTAGPLHAQDPAPPPAVRLPPDPPAAFLGFEPGEDRKVADWGQITGYLETLANRSGRVRLDTIGRSTLDRPMLLLTVTDTTNQRRLSAIKAQQAKLADPRKLADADERRDLTRSGRLVVLITAGVHPIEVGGSLVPLNLAYRLATATDSVTLRILRESVVLIVPAVNPDGVDLVADWYRGSLGTPWEGRPPPFLYHHYTGHDNNRDWYSFTQVETRNVVERVYHEWHPQIVHDMHQQSQYGSRFFVPPWLDPIEPNVDPLLVSATNALGTAIAWDLIRQGKEGVAVHVRYDAWSPERAYAHYHGAVRLLSETASARLASPLEVLREELEAGPGEAGAERAWNVPVPWTGGRWGMADIVAYMEAGALSLLRNAVASRRAWLENFVAVGERAVAGWPEWPRAWIIPADAGTEEARDELTRILTTAGVEVRVAPDGLRTREAEWPAGSLVISMRQPYAAFAQMVLAPQPYPGDRLHREGQVSEPYDVTAHNLPLFLGVRAVAAGRLPAGQTESLETSGSSFAWRAPGLSGEPGLLVGLYQSWFPIADEGWTRWLFDRYEVPYATVHDRELRQEGLVRRFTSIVLPSVEPDVLAHGWKSGTMPEEYTGGLGTAGAENLRRFVEEGGTLIALGRSTEWAVERLNLAVVDRLRRQPRDVFFAPGAQIALRVDTTTSIGRGMPVDAAAWIEGGAAFDLPAGSTAVRVATYGGRPRVLSGWVRGIGSLAGATAVAELRVGRGRVVLYGIDPQQRGISMATFPLLFNALGLER